MLPFRGKEFHHRSAQINNMSLRRWKLYQRICWNDVFGSSNIFSRLTRIFFADKHFICECFSICSLIVTKVYWKPVIWPWRSNCKWNKVLRYRKRQKIKYTTLQGGMSVFKREDWCPHSNHTSRLDGLNPIIAVQDWRQRASCLKQAFNSSVNIYLRSSFTAGSTLPLVIYNSWETLEAFDSVRSWTCTC